MTETTKNPSSRWRKKPVEIDAAPWDGSVSGATEIIDWVLANGGTARYHDEPNEIAIDTLEGAMKAPPGSWVLRGVAGEFYRCEPGIFLRTYEQAKSGPGMTPGRALYESLCETGAESFGQPASNFATWGQLPWEKQQRMETAALTVISADFERDLLDRALSIAAHETAFETEADEGAVREAWLREARMRAEAGK